MPNFTRIISIVCILVLTACQYEQAENVNELLVGDDAGLATGLYINGPKMAQLHTVNVSEKTAANYIKNNEKFNVEAVIPPQCYTKTDGVHNPCYVCHQSYSKDTLRPNVMRDGVLQGSYGFSDIGTDNHWTNLFKDRTQEIEEISDQEILNYINQENYSDLVNWLNSEQWQGEVPVIHSLEKGAEAFDAHGLAKDGSRWVAFNYKPMPSTFWPTNGSTDDVMLRLPNQFSEINGEFSRDLYYANLALVEMAITDKQEISSIEINEESLSFDINGDGILSIKVERVLRQAHYLGDASSVKVEHMLYPLGIEFLHTVRYLGFDEQGNTTVSKRFKEYRYMKKSSHISKARMASIYYGEAKEKHSENLPTAVDFSDKGISNSFGWLLWGFIEDENGNLRKQHDEEQFFCVGCHKTIGTTIDQTFSFPRKVSGAKGWGYIDLAAIIDVPNINESQGEYLTYLNRVGGGDEFRQNGEMITRWFNDNGQVNTAKVKALNNIKQLITPSKERALKLNKAYYLVVKEQSFLFGRDAVLKPAKNVIQKVDTEIQPLEASNRHVWDIRLDWDKML